MKATPLLLVVSLIANLALAAMVFRRPSTADSAAPAAAGSSVASRPAASNGNTDVAALQAALESGDSNALAAAGVPADVARALAIGRALDKMQARMRELRPAPATDGKYWRRQGFRPDQMTREQRMELNKVQRDFFETLRSAVGEDLDSALGGRDSQYSFLPAAKREQLRQIEQDYSEMQSQAYMDQEGIQLPSDREKLRLLRLEKERDIIAALSPEQREQYELHVSQTANNVRSRYGDAIQSEEEYRRIFALQKAFDDQFSNAEMNAGGPPSPEMQRARREAEQKLQEDIRASLNPEQLAALQRANDDDYRTVGSLARRLNLPAGTTDVVLASRETYAAQSMQINANASLSNEERRNQLQALAARAQSELQGTLGPDGAQAYAQRSQWIGMLKNGTAFSTNAKDAPAASRNINSTIFMVQPPRAAPAAAAPGVRKQ
ncbi:MAG TPA: hypothetical protein VHO24_15200 [Opitutaceae bacterium]|nr:hypothetical protein [Opitutaceae bacterium]